MRDLSHQAIRPSRVTALYKDNARSFSLKGGATLGDLADRLAQIEESNGRKPTAIEVKFDA
jgi:hypothetical protein